jgi:2-polyprenyl-3-methyl-5-hydroxy-6-metoxy-1,4-benzoquinol methylase
MIRRMQTDPAITEKRAWQDPTHASVFDEVSFYPDFLMRKRFESFNEVRLLRQNLPHIRGGRLYEIGCATGEFGRYVARQLPQFSYRGFDISRPAIERAIAKYGSERYVLLEDGLTAFREKYGSADVVFCRDVVLHQLEPYRFLASLLELAEEALVLRLRTREVGDTLLDAEESCQLHYDRHWVPYIVLNTQELVSRLCADPTVQSVVISRRFEPLGGHNFRHLPKDLFFSSAGSAETAVFVAKGSPRAGKAAVTFDDRRDGRPGYALWERALLKMLRSKVG